MDMLIGSIPLPRAPRDPLPPGQRGLAPELAALSCIHAYPLILLSTSSAQRVLHDSAGLSPLVYLSRLSSGASPSPARPNEMAFLCRQTQRMSCSAIAAEMPRTRCFDQSGRKDWEVQSFLNF